MRYPRISRSKTLWTIVLLLAALGAVLFLQWGEYRPAYAVTFHVYLTLTDDPAHSMIVNYQTLTNVNESNVYYDVASKGGKAEDYTFHATATPIMIAGLEDERRIHRVRLDNLEPGRVYHFIAGDTTAGFSKEMKFRTIPADSEKIRFVTGGDINLGTLPADLLRHAGEQGPMFAVIGGDIAYANGDLKNVGRWDKWFENWTQFMVTPEGLLVPIVATPGNHETNKEESDDLHVRAPFYMAYFGHQAETIYFSRRIGKDVVMFLLDTGHLIPHEGAQTEWLGQELERYRDAPVKFACYHVPLYPAHRDFMGSASVKGRELWGPLFDEYRLMASFENHDHVFKRSHLLRNNQIDPEGVLYLGDGCFGVPARTVDEELRWYLARAERTPHFWLVEVEPDGIRYAAVDRNGTVFDEVTQARNQGSDS